jgi:hypothetical protein
MLKDTGSLRDFHLTNQGGAISRKMVIAILLGVALIAFEIFNFDTTQFALTNLLGDVRFAGVLWASILAIAFCAIDFAGLVRIFTPQRGAEEPRAVWFLTGAWFLGTIANAVMTWWAVSLTLLSHEFGNEVLSREMLLRYVPIFVAMLVWLTRILFIGAFSMAGEDILDRARTDSGEAKPAPQSSAKPAAQPARTATTRSSTPQPRAAAPATRTAAPAQPPAPPATAITYEPVDDPVVGPPPAPKTGANSGARPATSRIGQRPPMPGNGGMTRAPGGVHAQSKNGGHR